MLRVAVAGGGYWGKNHVRTLHNLGALTAVCDTREDVLSHIVEMYPEVRTVSDYDQLLADDAIDAVVIATPAEKHAEMAAKALDSAKHVLVEKPLCLSVPEGESLVSLAEHRKRTLMVGHLLWYHAAVLKLKELIDNGELGDLLYIYSSRLNLGKIRREENILWSFAPHDISVILGLLGTMPDEVHSHGGSYLQEDVADVTMSLLSFPNGVKAHIFVSWLHPFKEQKLVVVGSERMAVFNDVSEYEKLQLYDHKIDINGSIPVVDCAEAETVPLAMDEPLKAECRHFIECAQTGAVPRTDGNEGLRVLKVLEQCQGSLREVP